MTALANRPDHPTGNPDVLDWCPVCVENVVSLWNGTCPWCDTTVMTQDEKAQAEDQGQPVKEVDDPKAEKPKIPPRRDRGAKRGKSYSNEQMIARVRLWAKIMGRTPTKRDWQVRDLRFQADVTKAKVNKLTRQIALYEMGDWPSETTVRERFGSLNALLVAAGFEPRPAGRIPVNEPPKLKFRPRPLSDISADIEQFRDDGNKPRYKAALYELAQAAIVLADKEKV